MVAERLKEILGARVGEPVFLENEPIGDRYILYKYRLEAGGGYAGCRLVAHDNTIVLAVCTLDKSLAESLGITPAGDLEPRLEPRTSRPGRQESLPPGQKLIPYPIVYRILGQPRVDVEAWRLRVEGLVGERLELTYNSLLEMPMKTLAASLHCVTGWSTPVVYWEGVPLRYLAQRARVQPGARWVLVEGLDGYTTVIPLEDFTHEDSLLALKMNGEPLSIEHGYPARILVPHLYGWKSLKWVSRIEFLDKYVEGYWEKLGYHPRGDVWLEERFKTF